LAAEPVTVVDGVIGLTPVTVAVALVAGAVMMTLGDTVTFEVLLLTRVMVSGDAGAAGTDTVKFAVPPRATDAFDTVIWGTGNTVTEAVAFTMAVFGTLAVIVTGPPTFTPVTDTVAAFVPAAMVTEAGTDAVVESLEARLTSRPPAGAFPDRVSVKGSTLPTYTVWAPDGKLIVAPTVTVPEPDV